MKGLGNTIYAFGCIVAATALVVGVFDCWFGDHHLTAFLSWAVLAALRPVLLCGNEVENVRFGS